MDKILRLCLCDEKLFNFRCSINNYYGYKLGK